MFRYPVTDLEKSLTEKHHIFIGEPVEIECFKNISLLELAGVENYNFIMERIIAANSLNTLQTAQHKFILPKANGACLFNQKTGLDKNLNMDIAECCLKYYFEERHPLKVIGTIISDMSDPAYSSFEIPMIRLYGKGYWNECNIAVGKITFNISGYCFYKK